MARTTIQGSFLGLASQAAGDVMYFNGTNWIRLAKGSADEVLTMNNGATAPEWEAAGGGGSMTLISSTNVTSNTTNIDFTGLSGYATYFLQVSNAVPTTDGPYAVMQVGDSSGIDEAQTDYGWHIVSLKATVAAGIFAAFPATTNSAETKWIVLHRYGVGSDTNEGFSCSLWIHNNGTQRTRIHGTYCGTSASEITVGGIVIGERAASITMDRIRFKFSAGSVESGRISLYGVSHA